MNRTRVLKLGAVTAALFGFSALVGSMVMAPGAQALGENLGWKTQSQALEMIEDVVNDHSVAIDAERFSVEDLGYTISVEELGKYRASLGRWNETIPVAVETNSQSLTNLKNLVPDDAPVNASISYDSGDWKINKSIPGRDVNSDALVAAINEDLNTGKSVTNYARNVVMPSITTEDATEVVSMIEDASEDAGVFLDDEQVFEISKERYATLLQVDDSGDEIVVRPDTTAINELVYEVAEEVKEKPDHGSAVVDENGKILKILDGYSDGREMNLEQMESLYDDIASGVVEGKGIFTVETTSLKAQVDEKFRRAVVDVDARRAIFYENEVEVYSFPVAVGKPGWSTDRGSFRVHTQLRTQDMGCGSDLYDYCVKGVPWISYYNGDEAFHGAFWHNDFGNPNSSAVSHGCVNMPVADAEKVYRFLQVGSPVEVR